MSKLMSFLLVLSYSLIVLSLSIQLSDGKKLISKLENDVQFLKQELRSCSSVTNEKTNEK